MSQAELAELIGVSYVRLNEIVNGRRRITPSTGLRLAKALGTTAQFWLNGQLAIDLYQASHDEDELRQLERIEPVSL
jgi:addiction module HigA family antidote